MERLDADVDARAGAPGRAQAGGRRSDARRSRRRGASLRGDEMALYGLRKDLERVVRGDALARDARGQQLAAQAADLARSADENEQRLVEADAGLESDARRRRRPDAAGGGAARARPPRWPTRSTSRSGELTTLKVDGDAGGGAPPERAPDAGAAARRSRRAGGARGADRSDAGGRRRARGHAARRCAAVARRGGAVAGRGRGAGARARRAPERAGGAAGRGWRSARPQLRTARAEVARLAQTLSRLELRSQEVVLRRTVAGRAGRRSLPRRRRSPAWCTTTTCARCSAPSEEQRATELRGLIERMGEINLTAIEESEELQKRFDFLTTQKADLESAISPARDGDRAHQPHLAQALPRDVRRGQRPVRGGVPPAVRRRAAQPAADRRERHARDRHRDHRQPARQEGQPEHRAAVGRREGADGGVAAVRDLPGQTVAVLRAG